MKLAGLPSINVERMVLQDLLRSRNSLLQNFNELKVWNHVAHFDSLTYVGLILPGIEQQGCGWISGKTSPCRTRTVGNRVSLDASTAHRLGWSSNIYYQRIQRVAQQGRHTLLCIPMCQFILFCFNTQVGENMSLIQSVKDSSYYQAYSDRITLWETKMTDLDFYLRHLSQIQNK